MTISKICRLKIGIIFIKNENISEKKIILACCKKFKSLSVKEVIIILYYSKANRFRVKEKKNAIRIDNIKFACTKFIIKKV